MTFLEKFFSFFQGQPKLSDKDLLRDDNEKDLIRYDYRSPTFHHSEEAAEFKNGVSLGLNHAHGAAIQYFINATTKGHALAAPTWGNIGVAQAKSGNYDDAIISFDKALTISPDYTLPLCNKATTLVLMSHPEDAIALYDSAIKINEPPTKYLAPFCKGMLLCKLEKYEEALKCFDKAAPGDYGEEEIVNHNIGVILRKLKRDEEAEIAFIRETKARYFSQDRVKEGRELQIRLNNLTRKR
jgi:tetratricopeptide (TPR) repeat protein